MELLMNKEKLLDLRKNRKKVLNICSKYEKIYIYGSDYLVHFFIYFLNDENIPINGILAEYIDVNKKFFYGVPIYDLDKISLGETSLIIIAEPREKQNEAKDIIFNKYGIKCAVYTQTEYAYYGDAIQDKSYLIPNGYESTEGYFKKYTKLDELGQLSGTDKSSAEHNYLNKYEFFLSKWKNKRFNILELGVFKGASIKMWGEFFPNATVYAVDIDPNTKKFTTGNRRVIIADLSLYQNVSELTVLKPDIIIDDASHMWRHQVMALIVLFDSLPHGGVYIVEDIETSFKGYEYSFYNDASITCYDFLSAVAEVVASGEYLRDSNVSAAVYKFADEINELAINIEMISFIKSSCIIIKK